jgi:hypothetical protein
MEQVGQFMRARLAACLATLGLSLIALPVCANDIETLPVEGGQIQLFVEDKPFVLGSEPLEEWVSRSATIVANYYGRFPVAETFLAIRGRPGRGVPGAVINVNVGLSTRQQDLHRDWVLIHELIHLAFPTVPRSHHWIEEGLAVYIESIARAAAGELTPEQVWAGFLDGMSNGLPRTGDRGLDFTPTWGRTYWGGALFCLLADVGIRQRTGNQKSIREALRAILAAGLDITITSELRPVLQLADAGTGTTVLADLYTDMGAAPKPKELKSLWRDLGVALEAGTIVFDDGAPLASIRQAITATDDSVLATSISPARLRAKIRSR